MPVQTPQWSDYLSCTICYNMFNEAHNRPISLGCGHTLCRACLSKLQQKKCPFDQTPITRAINELPVNFALLQLVGVAIPDYQEGMDTDSLAENLEYYKAAKKCIEELAIFLKPIPSAGPEQPTPLLSRPMQRKLVALVSCQLVEDEGRARAMRAARSLGERTVTELILQHQNPQQLSANLWAAVRARGCQFLGPAMQEEVLKLILLALEDGSALSRKVLVLFVVQRLEAQYPQASKTAIGHVVQLLYRASCFKVTKRDEESSLMQLKDEFRTYEALRREHDGQIVQIAMEAGLRISPEQWSSLLYGDTAHKSHMQSIIDKLQTPQSFGQSVNELVIALQRTSDPGNLSRLRAHLELLANIDPGSDAPAPSWENLEAVMRAVRMVVQGLVEFIQTRSTRRPEPTAPIHNTKYKTSMCRDLAQKGSCPRGGNCTFAHSTEEMERARSKSKPTKQSVGASSALTPQERVHLSAVTRTANAKIAASQLTNTQSTVSRNTAVNTGFTMHVTTASNARPKCTTGPILVPTAKPQMMAGGARSHSSQNGIYSCPTVGQEQLTCQSCQPSIVPIAQRLTPLDVSQFQKDNPYNMPASLLKHFIQTTSAETRPQTFQQTPYTVSRSPADAGFRAQTYMGQVANTKTVASGLSEFSPNHYSASPPSVGSMPETPPIADDRSSRGRSPSQHVEDLQSRRKELLDQLQHKGCQIRPDAHGQILSIDSQLIQELSTATALSMQQQILEIMSTMSITSKQFTSPAAGDMPMVMTGSADAARPEMIECDSSSFAPWESGYKNEQRENCSSVMSESDLHEPRDDDLDSIGLDEDAFECLKWTNSSFSQAMDNDESAVHELTLSSMASLLEEETFINMEQAAYSDTERYDNEDIESPNEDADDFIPFEHTRVSKYGPISRVAKAKGQYTTPVQVTASQPFSTFKMNNMPVTAVTPSQRPHPVPHQVPSRYSAPIVSQPYSDHIADPSGLRVATSLPTAHIKPSYPLPSGAQDEGQLQELKEKMLKMQGILGVASQPSSQLKLRNDVAMMSQKMDSLQNSENERLIRELRAIELNIQVAAKAAGHELDLELACEAQAAEMVKEGEKRRQEAEDRRYAELLALEEAERDQEQRGQPSSNQNSYSN